MIYQITGKLTFLTPSFLVIEASGVGYKIFISSDTFTSLKGKRDTSISLFTYQAVRENALDLFGFLNKAELDIFEKLVSVSGIGPKSGLGILSLAPVETLRKAIGSGDISYLTKVSGIGRKTAEKIVLELKDKLELYGKNGEEILGEDSDVLEALRSLGYKTSEVRELLKKIPNNIIGVSNRIKKALEFLSKTK